MAKGRKWWRVARVPTSWFRHSRSEGAASTPDLSSPPPSEPSPISQDDTAPDYINTSRAASLSPRASSEFLMSPIASISFSFLNEFGSIDEDLTRKPKPDANEEPAYSQVQKKSKYKTTVCLEVKEEPDPESEEVKIVMCPPKDEDPTYEELKPKPNIAEEELSFKDESSTNDSPLTLKNDSSDSDDTLKEKRELQDSTSADEPKILNTSVETKGDQKPVNFTIFSKPLFFRNSSWGLEEFFTIRKNRPKDDDDATTTKNDTFSLEDETIYEDAPTISPPLSDCDWGNASKSDYEELEYCQHRAQVSSQRQRRRSRIGKAWRAVRGWWVEERTRINTVIDKHAHAQAVGAETPRVVVVRRRQNGTRSRPTSALALRRSRYFPEGQNGFEELRRYIKQGGDFCKDLSAILQERSEVETQYAKNLSKLSSKLLKASKDCVGTVNTAWQKAGAQMEVQSQAHRAFATALSEEVVKPLRQLVEAQHRLRKSVEGAVEKTAKGLSDWRTAEAKSKKQSFVTSRENEKLQDSALLDVRLGRHHQQLHNKIAPEKLETKRRKAEEAVKKADVEYYTFCIRAERARLEWETAVIQGSQCFQALEEERLQHLGDFAANYHKHLAEMAPKVLLSIEKLAEPIESCDVAHDIQTVVSIKGTGQPIPEQLLPDFYAEHITLAMNRERRRQALVKLLQLIRQDIERERRGKQGVENLARALQQTPNFGADESQQNVSEKLHHMRSMLTYLEAARYKVQSALCELDGKQRPSHPLASHIQVTRDRQGLQQSVLKVPPWVRKESLDQLAGDSPDWTDRGTADGNSVQPDSDFDEFSSQGSEKEYQSSVMISECHDKANSTTSRCRAVYEYAANLYDELNLAPGDVINIHAKQADGWWVGELNGNIGIFPATYVEEIK